MASSVRSGWRSGVRAMEERIVDLGGFFWTSLVFRAEVSESGRCTAQDKDGALTSFGAHRLQQTTRDGGVACKQSVQGAGSSSRRVPVRLRRVQKQLLAPASPSACGTNALCCLPVARPRHASTRCQLLHCKKPSHHPSALRPHAHILTSNRFHMRSRRLATYTTPASLMLAKPPRPAPSH